MKLPLIFSSFIFCLLSVPAGAQTEHWDAYIARFGDKTGSMMLDMGLMPNAPDKRYPYLVVTGPKVHNCDKQGLPNDDEIPDLESVLDATGNFITGLTAKVLVATFTYNCRRVNYYYVKDTAGIRNALGRMYSRSFPNYSYVISIRPDEEWTEYRTFIYPTETTRNWMANNKTMTSLKENGNDLGKPHDIVFDLYFRADTSRSAVMAYAAAKGYKTEARMNKEATNAPYELLASVHGLVTMNAIDSMSADLKAAAKLHKGFYNGWTAK